VEEELSESLRIAEKAAGIGARIVADAFGRAIQTEELKGAGDYVTDVDRRSEEAIREHLAAATPDVPILAEEGGGGGGERYWAVDPLDGTTNFLIGFPVVAVSVALIDAGRPVVGAVHAPMLGLAFSAARAHGAWSGGERLRVSERPAERAIVATAFPFRKRSLLDRYRPVLDSVFERGEDIRRAGAAALDLAWVASGAFDGYFELNLSVWDVAAGALLVEEAGGLVTDWAGGPDYLQGEILAGSPSTHPMLLEAARR
jgi:myo-inositol-1(or 4)-monophosphatase